MRETQVNEYAGRNLVSKDTYVEHRSLVVQGFRVVDATATGNRGHDDLVWVGYDGEGGRWLSPEEALAVASSIASVTVSHLVPRGTCDLLDAKQRVQHLLRNL